MTPKGEAREWLDERCGRTVHVETLLVDASAPTVNEGRLAKPLEAASEVGASSDGPAAARDLYEVGLVSYNLGDLPDDLEVRIDSDPADRLEMTFGAGTSDLITVMITVVPGGEG